MTDNNAVFEHILYIEGKIDEENIRLSEALLHIGFNQEKEMTEIDSISEKIRSYMQLAEELYSRLTVPRDIVFIPAYHYLEKLSSRRGLNVFFQKLSGSPDYANIIRDDDNRAIALAIEQ